MTTTMNAQTTNEKMTAMPPVENLQLTQEWDKVFPKSDKVDYKKVTFINTASRSPPTCTHPRMRQASWLPLL